MKTIFILLLIFFLEINIVHIRACLFFKLEIKNLLIIPMSAYIVICMLYFSPASLIIAILIGIIPFLFKDKEIMADFLNITAICTTFEFYFIATIAAIFSIQYPLSILIQNEIISYIIATPAAILLVIKFLTRK